MEGSDEASAYASLRHAVKVPAELSPEIVYEAVREFLRRGFVCLGGTDVRHVVGQPLEARKDGEAVYVRWMPIRGLNVEAEAFVRAFAPRLCLEIDGVVDPLSVRNLVLSLRRET